MADLPREKMHRIFLSGVKEDLFEENTIRDNYTMRLAIVYNIFSWYVCIRN